MKTIFVFFLLYVLVLTAGWKLKASFSEGVLNEDANLFAFVLSLALSFGVLWFFVL